MNDEVDWDYFKATQTGSTAKAIQVVLDRTGKKHWIPKTVCDWHRDGILVVERWFAEKEGM